MQSGNHFPSTSQEQLNSPPKFHSVLESNPFTDSALQEQVNSYPEHVPQGFTTKIYVDEVDTQSNASPEESVPSYSSLEPTSSTDHVVNEVKTGAAPEQQFVSSSFLASPTIKRVSNQ